MSLIHPSYAPRILQQTDKKVFTGEGDDIQIRSILGSNDKAKILSAFRSYDYIFKIHTKKKEEWRWDLLDPIAGTPDAVRRVCDYFRQNHHVGMIYGKGKWIRRYDNVNEPLINEMCHQLKIKIDDKTTFVAGTIFWVRWSLLKKWIEYKTS